MHKLPIILAFLIFMLTGCTNGSGGTGGQNQQLDEENSVMVKTISSISINNAANKQYVNTELPLQYNTLATYSDNSTLDITTTTTWSSSNNSVAQVNKGIVNASKPGNIQLNAQYIDPATQKSFSTSVSIKAVSPGTFIWNKQSGGSNGTTSLANSLTNDINGNIIIAGKLQSSSYSQAFIDKYQNNGQLLWHKIIGSASTSNYTVANSVATDNNQNIYFGGYVMAPISTSSIKTGILTKYDTNGKLIWQVNLGANAGAGGNTQINKIAIDVSGNIYVTGNSNTTLFGQSIKGVSYFIAMYDTNGNLKASYQVNTVLTPSAIAITNDTQYVYIAGTNCTIMQLTNTLQPTSWNPKITYTGITSCQSMTTDLSGNIYVAGYTNGSVLGMNKNGLQDYFIIKYSTNNGAMVWGHQVGGIGANVYLDEIGFDQIGNIYVVGNTNMSINGQNQTGINDYYYAKHSAVDGHLVLARQIGAANGLTMADALSIDHLGNLYIAGHTNVALHGSQPISGIYYFIDRYAK